MGDEVLKAIFDAFTFTLHKRAAFRSSKPLWRNDVPVAWKPIPFSISIMKADGQW